MTIAMMMFMTAMWRLDPHGAPPPGFIALIWVFVAVLSTIFYTPSLIAGIALLKRKKWAKTVGIVAGVLASMSAPIGTAVCAYTFWFLFSAPGKSIYDPPKPAALPESQQRWYVNETRVRDESYTQPFRPPDWR